MVMVSFLFIYFPILLHHASVPQTNIQTRYLYSNITIIFPNSFVHKVPHFVPQLFSLILTFCTKNIYLLIEM